MSNIRKPFSPFRWILPAVILAIIAVACLYLVQNNYTHQTLIKEQNPNRKDDSNRVHTENKGIISSAPVNANDSIAIPKHDTVK